MHCASLLRTIFALLSRTHKWLRVHNVRHFPQAKLDTEINARFMLNEHGDIHILMHEFKLHEVPTIHLELKKSLKKLIAVKNTSLGSARYVRTQAIPKFLI